MIKPSSSKPGIRGAAEVPSLLYELRRHKAPQGIWPGFLGRWGDDSLGDSSREFCAGHAGYCFSWERDSSNLWEAPRGYQKVTCWKLHATSSRKIARIRLGQPIDEAAPVCQSASMVPWLYLMHLRKNTLEHVTVSQGSPTSTWQHIKGCKARLDILSCGWRPVGTRCAPVSDATCDATLRWDMRIDQQHRSSFPKSRILGR